MNCWGKEEFFQEKLRMESFSCRRPCPPPIESSLRKYWLSIPRSYLKTLSLLFRRLRMRNGQQSARSFFQSEIDFRCQRWLRVGEGLIYTCALILASSGILGGIGLGRESPRFMKHFKGLMRSLALVLRKPHICDRSLSSVSSRRKWKR